MTKCVKILSLLLAAVWLLAVPAAWAEENPKDILTSERWKGLAGDSSVYTFAADGSGTIEYSSGGGVETEWVLAGNSLTVSYELYGKRTINYELMQENEIYQLVDAEGNMLLRESDVQALAAQGGGVDAYAAAFGEKLTLGFADMTLTQPIVTSVIETQERGMHTSSASGTKFFCIVADVENLSGRALQLNNIRSEFTFDNAYTYSGGVWATYGDMLSTKLDPLCSGKIYLTAQIPDELAGSFSACSVVFSFDEGMSQLPMRLSDGDFVFSLQVDEALAAQAKQGPTREMVYYEECPVLPTPESYSGVYQSGMSSSSVNGKVTRIVYRYRSRTEDEKIEDVLTCYTEELTKLGFTVKNGKVTLGKTQIATLSIGGEILEVEIKPGNEGLKELPQAAAPVQEEEETGRLTLGDVIRPKTAEVVFEKYGSADTIYSSITKDSGWYTYYESQSGNPYFYLFGKFKNVSGAPADIRNIYAEFTFDGEYTYNADVAGVKKGASNFIDDVASQTSVNCYIYGEVPKSVIDSFETCVVRIGFTDDYGIRFSQNGLDDFTRCDEEFELEISRNGKTSAASGTYKTLEPGSEGQEVLDARMKLYELGYFKKKPTQTEYTSNMMDYVKKFEKDYGLKQDGILSPEDQEVLFGL